MGRYMRKAKISGEVAVLMDVSQSTLGVRTRAKTLALQRLLQDPTPTEEPTSYLQLRSRRLEKTNPRPNPSKSPRKPRADVGSADSGSVKAPSLRSFCGRVREEEWESEGGVEVSFGENVLGVESRERHARESTPCSMILGSDSIGTPGSTTRARSSNMANEKTQNAACRIIPTTHEVEEFFSSAEQLQQRMFMEKYNYDLVNDCPLPGRFEWVELNS